MQNVVCTHVSSPCGHKNTNPRRKGAVERPQSPFDGVFACLDAPPRPPLLRFGPPVTAPRSTSLLLMMTLGYLVGDGRRLSHVWPLCFAAAVMHAHASTPMRRPALHSTPLRLPHCGSRIGLVFALHTASVRASSIMRHADMLLVQPRVYEWIMSICDANCTIVSVEM